MLISDLSGNVVTMTSDGIKTGKTLSVLMSNTLKADADKLGEVKTIKVAFNFKSWVRHFQHRS